MNDGSCGDHGGTTCESSVLSLRRRVHTLLHKLPRSMAAAWQLGRLASRIEASQGALTSMRKPAALPLRLMLRDRVAEGVMPTLCVQCQHSDARQGGGGHHIWNSSCCREQTRQICAGGQAEGALQEAAAILRVPVQQLRTDDVVQLGSRLMVCVPTHTSAMYPLTAAAGQRTHAALPQ